MQLADTRTFLTHYLPRRVTADTQAIVRGLEPQQDMMRAICRMSRSIDPRRTRKLTTLQSWSVNSNGRIQDLIKSRGFLKRRLGRQATKIADYQAAGREFANERQRQRHALLKTIQE
jgi:hypothetical protein